MSKCGTERHPIRAVQTEWLSGAFIEACAGRFWTTGKMTVAFEEKSRIRGSVITRPNMRKRCGSKGGAVES